MKTSSFAIILTLIMSITASWGTELLTKEKIFQFMLKEGVVDNLPGFGLTKIAKHQMDRQFSPSNDCSLWKDGIFGNVSCGAMAKSISCDQHECKIQDAYSAKVIRVNDGAYGEGFTNTLNKSLCKITGNNGCVNQFARLQNFICYAKFKVIRSGFRKTIECDQML